MLSVAAVASGAEYRLITGNDYLAHNSPRDDLFTFALGLAFDSGPYTVSFQENAFTDRDAGTRFDESFVAVGRAIPGGGPWHLYAEAGVVYVGRGLFGQRFQNDVHQVIGEDELDLRYLGSHLHGSFEVMADRLFEIVGPFELGPRLEAYAIPGLRSHVVVGAHARWHINQKLALDVVGGGRWSDAYFHPLVPHLADLAPMARVAVDVSERVYVSWTLNEYGDERQHVSVGYRVGSGKVERTREERERDRAARNRPWP